MRLIITRHGETEENIKGIFQGQNPGTLSDLGIEQAEKVASRLKEEKIDYIFSSDLARSSDTAKIIMKHHPEASVHFVKELRERHLGEYQGRAKSEFGWRPGDFKSTRIETRDGESIESMYKRAERFLHEILSKHKNDTILFVTHAGIKKALVAVITGKKHFEIKEIENPLNTSVSIFDIDEDKNHKIHVFNCINHLD